MNKLFKIVLSVVGSLVLLAVIAIAAFALFFDANTLRGPISARVKTATSRDMTIGDIHVSIYPVLGVSLKQVSLANAPGFGDAPFATAGEIGVGLRILPLLLHRQLEIRKFALSDAQLHLIRNADGSNDWDDLQHARGAPAAPTTPGNTSPAGSSTADIGGIEINNAAVSFEDRASSKTYAIGALNLKTGAIHASQPFDIALDFAVQGNQPPMSAQVTFKAQAGIDGGKLDFENLALGVTPTGGPLSQDDMTLTAASLQIDHPQKTFSLANGKFSATGFDASFSLSGSGLGSEQMQIVGPLTVQPFSPRNLMRTFSGSAAGQDATPPTQLGFSATLDLTGKSLALNELKGKFHEAEFSGQIAIEDFTTRALSFALKADQIDLDPSLPNDEKSDSAAPPENGARPNQSELDRAVPPLDRLNALNANGTLDIGALAAHGLKLSDVHLDLHAPKDEAKHLQLNGHLYGGSIAASSDVTPAELPRYAAQMKLQGVSIGPLLKDFSGREPIDGTGDFSLSLSAAAHTVGEMRRAANGKLAFNLHNGALRGFSGGDLAKQAEALRALVGGGSSTGANANGQQTEFANLSGTATITDGVLHNDDLAGVGPMFKIGGSGNLDLVRKTIDYLVKLTVVASGQTPNGFDLARLDGVVLPVHIGGTFANPTHTVDLRSALQQKALDKIRGRILGTPPPDANDNAADPRAQLRERLRERFGRFLGTPPSNPPPGPAP